jgi:sporulation protein YlmC with PRC-barrel domain
MTGEEVLEWRGCEVIDRDGDKVGTLEEIYFDEQTRKPEWAIVKSGLFGRSILVPLIGAMHEEERVRVRYEKDTIKDAPKVDVEGGLTQDEEEEVYRHYGLDYTREESASGLPDEEAAEMPRGGPEDRRAAAAGAAQTAESPDRSAPDARGEDAAAGQADAEGESEDEPATRTERRATERLRLTRYVVTEHVPVQREEVRVEREPVGEGGDAPAPGEGQDR